MAWCGLPEKRFIGIYRAQSDFADAKLSPPTAAEFARLWAEADATLHVERGTP
jgi:hypothetical protein